MKTALPAISIMNCQHTHTIRTFGFFLFAMVVLWTRATGTGLPETPKLTWDKQLAAEATEKFFEPSLAAMEGVDFLLTPGLLVQEAFLDDVVPSYPAE